MSDRFYGSIHIGGPIKRELVAGLVKAIQAEAIKNTGHLVERISCGDPEVTANILDAVDLWNKRDAAWDCEVTDVAYMTDAPWRAAVEQQLADCVASKQVFDEPINAALNEASEYLNAAAICICTVDCAGSCRGECGCTRCKVEYGDGKR